jgi:predicted HicB family RNase H-like nuclease
MQTTPTESELAEFQANTQAAAETFLAADAKWWPPGVGTLRRRELRKIGIRLPPDVHEWISAQAARNQSSINSESIRAIRDAMDGQVDCTSADLGSRA